jgi:hypothetical protein
MIVVRKAIAFGNTWYTLPLAILSDLAIAVDPLRVTLGMLDHSDSRIAAGSINNSDIGVS